MANKNYKKNKIQNKKIQAPKPKQKKTNLGLWIVSFLILIIIGLIIYGLLPDRHSKMSQGDFFTTNRAIVQCFKNPEFPQKFGYSPPYAIDLKQDMENKGLKIIEANTGRILKLPGWESFGFLGLYTRDQFGNIYTSPVPYVSIDINPPGEQNKILRVDNATGEMKEFVRLPSENPPTPANPFGVIGLNFDCETNSLYATSVAGSSPKKETGKIFQIDPTNGKTKDTYDNFDALGIALFVGNDGKRAYLGSARKPEIYSVGIDKEGGFENDLRFEFSLVDVPNGSFHKAHRIKIEDDIMILKTREFSYTLIAASEVMRTEYKFRYNRNKGVWEFEGLIDE